MATAIELLAPSSREACRHRQHLERQHGRRAGDVLDKGKDHGQIKRSR